MSQDATKAPRTCLACKQRKRKCDRGIPSCSYCASIKISSCDYSKPSSRPGPNSTFYKPSRVMIRQAKDSQFPAVFFLDSRVFQQSQMEIPRVTIPVPSAVTALIGDLGQVKVVAAQYFQNIHYWWPIISKLRFYKSFLNPLAQPRPDVSLLLLCMQLAIWSPFEGRTLRDPQTMEYLTVKRFFVEVEASGIFTVQVLQAYILLALYELGHAIYPSAYISIGACARYSSALLINAKSIADPTEKYSWVEREERRRVWWAIAILDRFANLGCPERPLSTPDLRQGDILPADDAAWDEGINKYDTEFSVLSSTNIKIGKFARLAQATNLLAQVLRHVSDKTSDEKLHYDETIQLDRTIRSLINLTNYEGQMRQTSLCLQNSFCYSGLMILHDPQSMRREADSQMGCNTEHNRWDIREALSDEIAILSRSFLLRITQNVSSVETSSPLLLYWAYQASQTYTHLYRDTGNPSYQESLKELRQTLKTMDCRWRVAGTYLQILDAMSAIEIN